jgi:hypothetical protein
LNVGFALAKKRSASVYIFHDVDLLPSRDLLPYYERVPPVSQPVHIARVWNRYSNNPNYFGGIVAFSKEQFETINGFPNNFWGWGGEDDELIKRVKQVRYVPGAPINGTIEDMEQMSLKEKIDFLRLHRDWKCQKKWEVLSEHETTWEKNGLADLHYSITGERSVGAHCTVVTVEIGMNGHWTDDECLISVER